MPDIPKPVDPKDRICAFCRSFEVLVLPKDGLPNGPVCRFWNQPFPNTRGWARGDGSTPPGERTCDNWKMR